MSKAVLALLLTAVLVAREGAAAEEGFSARKILQRPRFGERNCGYAFKLGLRSRCGSPGATFQRSDSEVLNREGSTQATSRIAFG